MSLTLLQANTPTFSVDGERRASLSLDVRRLEIDEDVYGMKRLSARFVAWGPREDQQGETELYLDGRVFDFGRRLSVALGPQGGACTVFDGKVSAIEARYREGAEPEALVFAEDALAALRLTRRSKTWERVSDADIARSIAAEHGLIPDVDADGPTYPVVQQFNQSDLAFLRERARLIAAELWTLDGKLGFKRRDRRGGSGIELINGADLVELQIRADLAHQRSATHVTGYDVAARDGIDGTVEGDVARAEAPRGRLGSAVLAALGDYPGWRTREVPLDSDAARAWAQAQQLQRARGFVAVRGITSGTPQLAVGATVTLARVAAPFAGGGYHVTRVRHSYDEIDGHRTLFEAERPYLETP
ncbi:contractile injection system protein, VgrG/Pvc8 family [Chitiniphilus purpureus]|uniref:Contractile injection system protein, VgrG/Pvc8 family n=1 Tax=Chitiniphilus purpureus TaxID=2981137 RepID=A0ABY6DJZ7_9NEIS|nr:contractile injection system protein, VgrG/Pvc8 family [Chitiniphilus sp. CD1]UXY14685.1 contractile injection system protein, VgrG/Pvc8 family [Chitiniphilus sp. CD1]